MTEMDPEQPGSGTEAPAAPGAEVDTDRTADERQSRDTDQNTDASATEPEATSGDQEDQNAESSEDAPEATSPELEHVKETIGKAKRAADEALAPQRD